MSTQVTKSSICLKRKGKEKKGECIRADMFCVLVLNLVLKRVRMGKPVKIHRPCDEKGRVGDGVRANSDVTLFDKLDSLEI